MDLYLLCLVVRAAKIIVSGYGLMILSNELMEFLGIVTNK
jgi:hypothetical protein